MPRAYTCISSVHIAVEKNTFLIFLDLTMLKLTKERNFCLNLVLHSFWFITQENARPGEAPGSLNFGNLGRKLGSRRSFCLWQPTGGYCSKFNQGVLDVSPQESINTRVSAGWKPFICTVHGVRHKNIHLALVQLYSSIFIGRIKNEVYGRKSVT